MSILGALGSIAGAAVGLSNASKQSKLQEKFAKRAIQWKVADAKAAGIHPLYALGAQTTSYSPVSVGDVSSGLSNAGQDISRAVEAARSPEDRVNTYQRTVEALTLKRMSLENDLLASKIRTINQPGTPPGTPEKLENPQRTRALLTPDGVIVSDPNSSDQQAFEDRYGEIVGEAYGLRNWFREVARPWWEERTGYRYPPGYVVRGRPVMRK